MFFYLSKIVWALASPLNFLTLLAGAGLLLMLAGWRRAGGRALVVAAILLVLPGVFPVGQNLMTLLEDRFPYPQALPAHVDGIIVLGGGIDTLNYIRNERVELNDSGGRLTEFLDLARRYPGAALVYSGGSGDLFTDEPREADLARLFMEAQPDMAGRPVIYERDSRNTYENAMNSRRLAAPKDGQVWLLVTSAFHMPRSVGIFERAGWHVVPVPSGYKTDGVYRVLPRRPNALGGFYLLDTAVREFIGLAAYRATGKTASLFPGPSVDSVPDTRK